MSAYEFVQRGKVLIVKKQYQDAVKVCRLGLLAHPTLVEGRLVLGMALMALGRYDEVLSEMRVALQQDKSSPLGHLLKGEALLRKGDVRQAADALGRARDLDPGNDKVTALLHEVQQIAEDAGQGVATGAPTFGDVTSTRQYPARQLAGAAGGGDDLLDNPSAAMTESRVGVLSSEQTNPLAGEIAPPPRVGQGSGIELVRRDEDDFSDPLADLPEDTDFDQDMNKSPSEVSLGAAPAPYLFDDSDVITKNAPNTEADPDALETESYPGGMPGVLPAPEHLTDSREFAPPPPDAMAGEDDATGEDEEPEPTLEARRARRDPPPRDRSSLSGIELDSSDLIDDGSPRHAGGPATFDHEEPTTPASPGAARRLVDPPSRLPLVDDESEDEDEPAPASYGGRPYLDSSDVAPTTPSEVREFRPAPEAPEHLSEDGHGLEHRRRYPPLPKAREAPPPAPPPRQAPAYPPPMVMPVGGPAAIAPTMPVQMAQWPPPVMPPSAPAQPPPQPLPQPLPLPQQQPSVAALAAQLPPTPYQPGPSPMPHIPAVAPAYAPPIEPSRAKKKGDPTGRTGSRKRRRQFTAVAIPKRGLGPIFLIVLAVVVVGVAVGAGLLVRSARQKQRMRRHADTADEVASKQTYRGYEMGLAYYESIFEETGSEVSRANRARLAAALVFEFGDDDGDAREYLRQLGDSKGKDAACARIYLYLADGKVDDALHDASELAARYPQDPEALYLHGRALQAKDDPRAAADKISESTKYRTMPLSLTTLAVLKAEMGQYDEALQTLDAALKAEPGHPAATIERYRLLAAIGRLDRDLQPDATFRTQFAQWTAQVPDDQPGLISAAQTGWASLTLAEILLAMGKDSEAKEMLKAAREHRPLRDPRFSSGLVNALLRVGETVQARQEADRALQIAPQAGAPHVWMAKIELAEGRPDLASSHLDKAGVAATRPEALGVRGQARLALGDLDGAIRNLDEALAKLPDDVQLNIARAMVDKEKFDNTAARRRLELLYEKNPDPELAVVFGAALVDSDRERARKILEQAAKSPRGAGGHLELARLHRLEGRFEDARKAYEAAMQRPGPLNVRARLEAALLMHDLGNAVGARESLDALARENPGEWEVQLSAAMLHAVTGNDAMAQKRLEDAARLTATPPWRLARERGRLAYLRGSFSEAVKELNEASRLRPDDLDARLLLMDAYYAAGDTEGMNRVKIEVLRRFEDRPEAKLAGGRFDLVLGKINSAITQLDDALNRLQARPAPPRVLAEVYTLLGHAFLDNGKLFKAEAYLQQAIKLDASSAEAHYWMGMVHLDHGYYLKAKAEFETALGLRPNYAQAWYDLGETSRRQKDKKSAERAYRKYLELAPDGTFASEVRDYLR